MNKKNNKDGNFDDIDFDNDSFETDYFDSESEDLEDASFEEDWNIDENTNQEATKTNKSKDFKPKSKTSFNTFIIVGAVIIGALVLVFNVMNQSGKQEQIASGAFQSSMGIADVMDGAVNTTDKSNTEVQSVAPAPQESVDQTGGFLDGGLESVPADSAKTETPPAPAPITTADNIGGANITPMPLSPDVSENDPAESESLSAQEILKQAVASRENDTQVAPVEDFSPQEPLAEKEEIISSPADEAPISTQIPDGLQDATMTQDDAVNAVEEKLNLILSRMDGIEKELSNLKTDNQALKEQVDSKVLNLKDSIDALEKAPSPSSISPVELEDEVQKPVVAKKKAASKVVPKVAAKSPAAKTTTQWELRAAQPGRAWISKKGDRDMQSVEVGQTISGLGVIRTIAYEGGLWTVIGSEGRVAQQ